MWDEIGESYNEIDNILEEIEQECLDVYDRKIAETIKYKAELQGSLAQADDEIVSLMSSLGEQVTYSRVCMLTQTARHVDINIDSFSYVCFCLRRKKKTL